MLDISTASTLKIRVLYLDMYAGPEFMCMRLIGINKLLLYPRLGAYIEVFMWGNRVTPHLRYLETVHDRGNIKKLPRAFCFLGSSERHRSELSNNECGVELIGLRLSQILIPANHIRRGAEGKHNRSKNAVFKQLRQRVRQDVKLLGTCSCQSCESAWKLTRALFLVHSLLRLVAELLGF